MTIRRLFSGGAMLLLAACAEEPMPQLAPGDVPAAFEQPAAAQSWPDAAWWQAFGDARLSDLIAKARARNLDLAQAAARLRQADARARQAGAALLPSVGLGADINTLYGQAKGTSQHETDWSGALAASYELDFWGRNRDAVTSAATLRAASAADRATVELGVTAAVANGYFQLLSLRERIAVARSNLGTARDILAIVRRRVEAGYAAASDLTQQRAGLAAEEAALPPLEQQELEARGALAILLGVPPEGFAVAGGSLDALAAPAPAPGPASELLTRRPDLVAAEANLAAAHADLKAARTAFLPGIVLTANGGIAYPALAAAVDTLPGTGLAASFGAGLVQTIFDGGRIAARTDEMKAREDELLAAYRAAAIAAFSDVENASANLDHLRSQEQALQQQAAETRKVLAAARRKYMAGYADFLAVTDAQRSLNAAQDQLIDIRRARLSAIVTLYKALGGGWRTGAKSPP